MSLEQYKNSTFVHVIFGYRTYRFDFSAIHAVQSVSITDKVAENAGEQGAGGSASVVVSDYFEDLFTVLTSIATSNISSSLERMVNSANRHGVTSGNTDIPCVGAEGNFGIMAIGMKCYSGTRVWFYNVEKFAYSFGSPGSVTFTLNMRSIAGMEKDMTDFDMFDYGFGAGTDTDPGVSQSRHLESMRKAIQDMSDTQGDGTTVKDSKTEEMPSITTCPEAASVIEKGVVGSKYDRPEDALKDLESMFRIRIGFMSVSSGAAKIYTIDEWVSLLNRDGMKLYFRGGAYEPKVFSSTLGSSDKRAYETEFSSILSVTYSAHNADDDEAVRQTYTSKTAAFENTTYLVAIREEPDAAPVDMEGANLDLERVVFMYNAPHRGLFQNRVVIPLDTLNVSMDSETIIGSYEVKDTANGTMVFTPSGKYMVNDNAAGTYMRLSNISMINSNRALQFTVTCRNFIHWGNTFNAYAEIYSYTSNGLAGVINGSYQVLQASYSWSGGVVTSSATLTKNLTKEHATGIREGGTRILSAADTEGLSRQAAKLESIISQFSGDDGGGSSDGTIYDGVSGDGPDFSQEGVMANFSSFKQLLTSPDATKVPISLDKTLENLSNGKFDRAVQEIIEIQKKSGRRAFSYKSDWFKKRIVEDGNYGLLCLIVAVANWGVEDVPTDLADPMRMSEDAKGKKAWFAPSAVNGKGFFDYTAGGLGIAHWDSGNLQDIYERVGFTKEQATKDMLRLIYIKDAAKASWSPMPGNPDRFIPVPPYKESAGEACLRKFDAGLSALFLSKELSSRPWQNWAKGIVEYKDGNGLYQYQYILTRLWVEKFWKPVIRKITKATLNDAFRIARACNSANSYGMRSCNSDGTCASILKQYTNYPPGKITEKGVTYDACEKKRYMNQKGFARRCADLVGYVYSHKG